MKQPWTKNFRSMPRDILRKLDLLENQLVVVAASKKIPATDLVNGVYSHIGLRLKGDELFIGPSHTPIPANGRYSKRNVEGWEIKRRDLPKITKSYTWESPNFGDSSKGTHMQSRDRLVYQKQFFEPIMMELVTELIRSPVGEGGTYYLKFSIHEVLDRSSETFEDRLFFALNLLRENTGTHGVHPSDVTLEDFQKSTFVDWEVFPKGTADEIIDAISSRTSKYSEEKKGVLRERINMFNAMKPRTIMVGSGGFGSYIGAEFSNDLVVFENTNYGNALYILFEGWEETSKRSRTDLLRGTNENYSRIIHKKGWENVFKAAMSHELRKRGIRVSKQGKFF